MTDDIARSRQARHELREQGAAFDEVRRLLVSQLLGSPISDSAGRERLYLAVQVLDAVKRQMEIVAETGDIELAAEAIRTGQTPATKQ